MQFINEVKQKAGELLTENASTLLTVGGVVGTVATGVLAAKAAFGASTALEAEKIVQFSEELTEEELATQTATPELPDLDRMTALKIAGPYFIPPVLVGGGTIVSIIMAHRMSAQKIAALAAAYGLAERNFSEYKAKVTEKLTGPKKAQVEEELAQEAVNATPGSQNIVFVEGEVLCFDKPTGRYFSSTMESIKQAVNATNSEIHNHGFARLSFFYQELGLPDNTWSDEVGFNGENLLDLDYSTVLAPGNKPCIAIDFKRLPKADFLPNY